VLTIDPEAKGGKRLAKALRVAVKSLYKRREVDRCRQNLQELNDQLASAMLHTLYARGMRSSELGFREADTDEAHDIQKALSH
jgi:site-specific recombinase XerD